LLYESFSTAEEIAARHRAAGRDPQLGYDNFDRQLSAEANAALRAEGRRPVLRVRMPDEDITFHDLIRGPVTFPLGSVPDFVVVRADGAPLYTFVNPVDDALMGITHVLRGEDLLSSTPRQIAMYQVLTAIGVADRVPEFGHLPYVMGQGNKKLSKRDPESNLFLHRERGFIPEGLLNYLSLLGWSIAEDRDVFTMEEMTAAFDLADVKGNPARFDLAKAEAINAEHIRRLEPSDFRDRLVPYLQAAGVIGVEPTARELAVLTAAAPLIQTRIQLLGEAGGLLGSLFAADEAITIADDALASVTKDRPGTQTILAAATAAVAALAEDAAATTYEEALRSAVVDGLGIKPRIAFGPLRVAVSGRKISPPLFESMEILGRAAVLNRLSRLEKLLAAG
jgi:glutamyl-tRNA synthetase